MGMISASATSLFLFLLLLLLLQCFMGPAMAKAYFSSLPRTLTVSASTKPGQVLSAGVDKFTVRWGLNQSLSSDVDSAYKKVRVRLCYAPGSQADRGWRKTADDLSKDKACQLSITEQPYADTNSSFDYTVAREIPTAAYFVRVYALDSFDTEVAYGQTTDAKKTTDLFEIAGITGRHKSLDITAACFSAFSLLSLAFFFVLEKRKARK